MSGRRALLVVDGYNVAHAWPATRALLSRRAPLEEVRALLLRRLAGYAAGGDLRVVVVFDGPHRPGQAAGPTMVDGVEVRFAGAAARESADHVIERLVLAARRGPAPPDVLDVATADRLVRDMVRAMGAQPLDPMALLGEVTTADADIATRIDRLDAAARHGGRVDARLRPDERAQLEALRRPPPPPAEAAPAAPAPRPRRPRGGWRPLSAGDLAGGSDGPRRPPPPGG